MDVALLQAAFNRELNRIMSTRTDTFDESRIETNSTYRQSRNKKKNRKNKRVTFNLDNNTVHDIPEEDRIGIWMIMSDNRHIFERRIQKLKLILDPILENRVCVSYV